MRASLLATTMLLPAGMAFAQTTVNVSGGGAALQNAISAAQPGETIVVGSGTYSPVTVSTSNLTIEAAAGAAPVISASPSASAAVTVQANNTTIQGFTFNASSAPASSTSGAILMVNVNGATLTNNTFQNINTNAVLFYQSDNVTIANNTATNVTEFVSGVDNSGAHSNISVSGNTVSGVSRIGVEMQGNYSNLQVNNNNMTNDVMGISIVEGPDTTGVSVSGNTISGGVTAIEASDANMTVTNNTISNATGGVSIAATPNGVFQNNTFTNVSIPIGQDGGFTDQQWVGTNTIDGSEVDGWQGQPNSSATAPATAHATTQAAAAPTPAPASAPSAAAPTEVAANEITPGNGSLTDASGNTWLISPSGSIQENGQWTPGGGGTSALALINGQVYGQDAKSGNWLDLSGSGQYWSPMTAAPAGLVPQTTQANGAPAAQAPSAVSTATASPAPVTATACQLASSGQFAEYGQTIYGPNQQPFVPNGVAVAEGNEPTVAQLEAAFPGINFVRYAIFPQMVNGVLQYPNPATLAPWINSLTNAGIVVEIEDHGNTTGQDSGGGAGTVFSGQDLANENAFYSAAATQFLNDPYVWFGTDNEPSTNPSVAALSNWQEQTYNAIRATGNNAPIMLEITGGSPPSTVNSGMVQSDYSGMTNTIWDVHYYGWLTNYSTTQTTVDQNIQAVASAAQSITNAEGVMPVVIGEYGNSTNGTSVDPNGSEVVTGVNTSGYGSVAWMWGQGNGSDSLIGANGMPSSPYGQQVASYIQQRSGGVSGTSSVAASCTATAAATPVPQNAIPTTAPSSASGALVPQNSLSSIPAPTFGAN
jgi:parallel beta-helix repeat protein